MMFIVIKTMNNKNLFLLHILHNNHKFRIVYTLIFSRQVFQLDDNLWAQSKQWALKGIIALGLIPQAPNWRFPKHPLQAQTVFGQRSF